VGKLCNPRAARFSPLRAWKVGAARDPSAVKEARALRWCSEEPWPELLADFGRWQDAAWRRDTLALH
jgi:hypothetical protein